MKTFVRVIVITLMLAACSARAELIIYGGTSKLTRIGENRTEQQSFKLFVVVDYDTANLIELFYANVNGRKFYSSETFTNQHFVEVIGANGRTNTAIARPRSDCAINEGVTSESFFAQGAATTFSINTNTTVSFPKMLTSAGQGYYPDDARIDIVSRTLSFDKVNTFTSNGAGEDLDEAAARLISALEKLGYTRAP